MKGLMFCVKMEEEFELREKYGKIVGFGHSLWDYPDDDYDNDYLVSVDPFTYKARGLYESNPEGS